MTPRGRARVVDNIWGSETDPEHPSAEEPQMRVITTLAPSMKPERGTMLHRVSVLFNGGCSTKAPNDALPTSVDTSCESQPLLFALRVFVLNQQAHT